MIPTHPDEFDSSSASHPVATSRVHIAAPDSMLAHHVYRYSR